MGPAPGICGRLPDQRRQQSASPAGESLTSLINALHRSVVALSKNTSMAVLFMRKSTAILVFSLRKSSVTVGMFCVTITFTLMLLLKPMFRVLLFLSNFGTILNAATLSSRKEVFQLENVIAFIISLVASVVSYYLCKWLDRDDT